LERNKILFEAGRPSTKLVSQRILGSLDFPRSRSILARLPRLPLVLDGGKTTCWFDGAAQEQGLKSGVGGVLRMDEHTKFSLTLNYGPGSNNRAELLEIWALLIVATRLQVFSDTKIVFDWLNQRGNLHILNL
jgi:hypothetical protein